MSLVKLAHNICISQFCLCDYWQTTSPLPCVIGTALHLVVTFLLREMLSELIAGLSVQSFYVTLLLFHCTPSFSAEDMCRGTTSSHGNLCVKQQYKEKELQFSRACTSAQITHSMPPPCCSQITTSTVRGTPDATGLHLGAATASPDLPLVCLAPSRHGPSCGTGWRKVSENGKKDPMNSPSQHVSYPKQTSANPQTGLYPCNTLEYNTELIAVQPQTKLSRLEDLAWGSCGLSHSQKELWTPQSTSSAEDLLQFCASQQHLHTSIKV